MVARQCIVITGASSGIGWAIAERFAKGGWSVFGSVRNAEDGERLRGELGAIPLLFDVLDAEATAAAAEQVAAAIGEATLAGLVNNAGISMVGPLLYMPLKTLELQMNTNFSAVVRLQQQFAPLLGVDSSRKGQPGRIVQMSSTSGSEGLPLLGAYSASKHALEGMSESLRRELMMFGIEVSIIAPGAITTPIWHKGNRSQLEQYAETPYGPALEQLPKATHEWMRKGLPASRVANAVWHAMTARKPKLRYEVIPNKLREYTIPRLLPKRLLDRYVAGVFSLRKARLMG